MKYFSLFSGIGGFELGIKQASKDLRPIQQKVSPKSRRGDNTKNKLVKWECVGHSEIDKYAIQIYQKHFPTHKNYGDATKIDTRELPNFDLLVGGFPCQAFSIAGKRKGFNDTRGTLFFEIARILRDKRPRYFLLENVKGLLSHDFGKTFQTILGVLTDLGYELEWQVLNSKNFGVPQNRERVFIIGYFGEESRPKVFPIGKDDPIPNKEQQKSVQRQIQADQQGGSKPNNNIKILENGKDRPLHQVGLVGKKDNRRNQGQERIQNETYLKYIGAIMTEKNKKWVEEGKELSREFPQGQRVYSSEGIASTLAPQAGGLGAKTGLYETDMKIRRLTPTECERLQGFPDGWTEGISSTQRYKCLGNAVTVNVIEAIMKRLAQNVLI